MESRPSPWVYIKRRIIKLGWTRVTGQLLFLLTVPFYLKFASKRRIRSICNLNGLNVQEMDGSMIKIVDSINSSTSISHILQFNPEIILVSGTRIISKTVLKSTNAIFLNIHAGITPQYRGVHGAYWALVNNDQQNCGVTVHVVDSGIDTGRIVKQGLIRPEPADNYSTYPFLQLGKGLVLLDEAIDGYAKNTTQLKSGNEKSQLWYHPTLIQYLKYRLQRNVK